jgi:alkylhydroperoxidase/carboxymuconolactone decarboxylase family protein YurZ
MRLGVDEVGVTELMAVTEHARAMSTAAAGLLLERLDDEGGLVAPLAGQAVDEEVAALLEEIRAEVAPALGRPDVPVLWRILAHNPHYLRSTWRKEQVVMRDGALAARDKRRTALGVAMSVRARYMIEYHAALLRRAGDGDPDVLEILGVVDHYTTLNTLSEGMRIESDIVPPS